MSLLSKFAVSPGSEPDRAIANTTFERMLSATVAVIDGRETILAGTNNYLGLTFDQKSIAAAQKALEEEGTGTTGSRMANGNYRSHGSLEEELAAFYGLPHAIVFSTGYTANLGMLSALVEPGDCVLLDADAHASLYDGCRMSGADTYRFKHNDPDSLAKRLERLGARSQRTLIVTEGLFSIMGDTAPLAEYVDLKDQYGANLLVDEAHSLGVCGESGRGVAEQTGTLDRVDFIVGTFSKSLGSAGGFCVSRHDALRQLRFTSRPYIFTASGCPSAIASTRVALQALRERPELRKQLWQNAERLYHGLQQSGFVLGPEMSPVVAVRMPDRLTAQTTWQQLMQSGVYTNLIVPPASPDGSSLIRCSASAAHSTAQIDAIIQAFRATRET